MGWSLRVEDRRGPLIEMQSSVTRDDIVSPQLERFYSFLGPGTLSGTVMQWMRVGKSVGRMLRQKTGAGVGATTERTVWEIFFQCLAKVKP